MSLAPPPPQPHLFPGTSPIAQCSPLILFSLSWRFPVRTCQEVDCTAAGSEGLVTLPLCRQQ